MKIHSDFTGGNIRVREQDGDRFYLENELRDTWKDWFYWAFCAEQAQGRTVTFVFGEKRLGYFGPAVSHDLKNWKWLDAREGDSFTYTFGQDEDRVYFAHHMLYHPERFEQFAERHEMPLKTFCESPKGRKVPCAEFGRGEKKILLTARHHACESTGNYVLEGVLEVLLEQLPDGYSVLCVPFVDYDGVIEGDQGKFRIPHDHYKDYDLDKEPIYPQTKTIREYVAAHSVIFAFDFHSPWHLGGENDLCFIAHDSAEKLEGLNRLGELFEASITGAAFPYFHKNDHPQGLTWNTKDVAGFPAFVLSFPSSQAAFPLELAYFGRDDNRFTQARAVETGRCFGNALVRYMEEQEADFGRMRQPSDGVQGML